MDWHLIDLSQFQQIKLLYNLSNKQLRKPPKSHSSQIKWPEDCKLHLGTLTLNLNLIHCRPTVQTCSSKTSGSPWWHHLQSPCKQFGNPVLCPAKGHQEISSRGGWAVGQTVLPWRWGHHAGAWYCCQMHGQPRCIFHLGVNYSFVNFFRGLSLSFPDSMSNLLIKTGAIKTFLKTSSFKHSLGNFNSLSSSPFSKPQNLKQRSVKMFALQLFGKFIQLYPTLKGCQ